MSGYMNHFFVGIYILAVADVVRIVLRYHVHDH